MNWRCRLGWHKWGRVVPATYSHAMHEMLGMPSTPAMRACQRCTMDQHRDEHCLGLNPPAYSYQWYDVPEPSPVRRFNNGRVELRKPEVPQ